MKTNDEIYDVVVIGGGAAGLSGALTLARAQRSVLVIDAGEPRNAPAAHMHNYLTRDGLPPAELLTLGRAELAGYGAEHTTSRVTRAIRQEEHPAHGEPGSRHGPDSAQDGSFELELDDRRRVQARRILITTGVVDELPEIAGLAARWGHDVQHCPYCHGWELRGQRIGVLATGPAAVHQAQMWRQWSDRVLLLLHKTAAPDDTTAEQLAARQITVVEGAVTAVETTGDKLTGVRLATGELVDLDAIVVMPFSTAESQLLTSLGLAPAEVEFGGTVMGSQVQADASGATAVPGVWVAGNVADVSAQVLVAAAMGTRAGAAINADLVAADTRLAVDRYRHRSAAMLGQDSWDEWYRAKPAVWSGRPNPQLVAEIAALPPGRALDVGCGEGADAIWLAERGWQVTAVDIAQTALERAVAHARDAGEQIAARITFECADLRRQPPPSAGYDLVSAQFMQLPPDLRRDLFARLADAVAPGGALFIVGHHPVDLRGHARRMHFPEMMYSADEIAAELAADRWEVQLAETRPRIMVNSDQREVTIHDAVLLARRR